MPIIRDIDYLYENTVSFAESASQVIQDITPISYTLDRSTIKEESVSFNEKMVVYIHFSGGVEGLYLFVLEIPTAVALYRSMEGDGDSNDLKVVREYISSFLSEVLNITVGQSSFELEKEFGLLSYGSAIVVVGDIVFPSFTSASVHLRGLPGDIQCVFSLNRGEIKIEKRLKKVQKDLEQKTRQAYIDKLSDLYNRTFFDEFIVSAVEKAKRTGEELSLLIMDIDHFKNFNDTYGHQFGDMVIRSVATIIKNTIRKCDVAARYGGDEIVIVLPEAHKKGAEILANRLKRLITGNNLIYEMDGEKESVAITVSMGIGGFERAEPEDNSDTYISLFNKADTALYRAKEAGRNCVRVY